ncbi:MAG: hypothetical protein QOJ76_576 [Acidobacteriota bacterium]|nr:hypothetical protein [Acidobacteriota bacterium]
MKTVKGSCLVTVLALSLAACSGGQPSNVSVVTSPTPESKPTAEHKVESKGTKDAEFDAELGDDLAEDRAAARKAVFDYVGGMGRTCKGVALRSVNGNIYVARVDAPGDPSLD